MWADVLRNGRQKGLIDAPTAFETDLGWVLCGSSQLTTPAHVASFHTSLECPDDILMKMEETPADDLSRSVNKQLVVRHFECNHRAQAVKVPVY